MNELQILKSIAPETSEQKEVLNKIIKEIEEKENKRLFGSSRLSSIKALLKNNKDRENLIGYHTFGEQFAFTDSYIMVVLNNVAGQEKSKKELEYSTINNLFNGNIEVIDIKQDDLFKNILVSDEFVFINNLKVNKKKLKLFLKIIGNFEEICIINKNMLYLKNKDNEKGILMGVK